jgi:predicted nucleotidyltransferase
MLFDIYPTIILLAYAGSHAYGMATEGSDVDLRGICVAPLDIRLSSYKSFEQCEEPLEKESLLKHSTYTGHQSLITDSSEDLDTVVYDIQKAIKLMGNCNPNMIEIAFCDDKDIIINTELGGLIRSNRDLFLSTKLKHTYTGYARAQLSRIKRHRGYLMKEEPHKPTRKEYRLPDSGGILDQREQDLINEEIKSKLLAWSIEDFEMLAQERDVLRQRMREFYSHALHCSDEEVDGKLEDVAAKSLGLTNEVRDALRRERQYRAALKNYKSYQGWKNERNPKRKKLEDQYGFDTKHASHLIRLARTGVEVLETGKLIVKRPDAAELLGIRQGKRTFEDIEEEAMKLEEKMNSLYKENPCNLPSKPNVTRLDELSQHIILKFQQQNVPFAPFPGFKH